MRGCQSQRDDRRIAGDFNHRNKGSNIYESPEGTEEVAGLWCRPLGTNRVLLLLDPVIEITGYSCFVPLGLRREPLNRACYFSAFPQYIFQLLEGHALCLFCDLCFYISKKIDSMKICFHQVMGCVLLFVSLHRGRIRNPTVR